MTSLLHGIATVYALLATVPFLAFALFWGLGYLIFRDKKRSTRLAMDVTTLLLVGAVASMWNRLFQSNFGFWLIVLAILIAVGLLGGYQNREKGAIDMRKIVRIVWRIGFVCLSALYVVFLVLNIGAYLIKFA
ncbi:hypothetical protein SD70_05030 [Gordoniibacillus kamchatkensis]|uniref:DUF3397 domain-containing protein n=1 Tax=Gordoniibacillus kamchatkensis TaxID=1590651 RepID=A0ABR5ALA6_9BACL|nr:DUF3397 domain-containing protein [Paenibacillus sp. VKM B-2647]KIL41736.1 hypothetical protein SD70_05030 [Paenibacillus sp. VKM B-2647]